MKNMLSIIIMVFALAFSVETQAQGPSKKCPTCGLSMAKCQYKGKHPKQALTLKCKFCGKLISKCPYKGKHPKTNTTNSQATGRINGHKWVDLGLSVKWATCNVGANKPEDYGDYFAWGETHTKEEYAEDTYTYAQNPRKLDAAHDAATANWGSPWRMPTVLEMEELDRKCTWTLVRINGVVGYKISSNVPGYKGASIFLPKAGYRQDYLITLDGNEGTYWSSTLNRQIPNMVHGITLFNGMVGMAIMGRALGRSVRAVCP